MNDEVEELDKEQPAVDTLEEESPNPEQSEQTTEEQAPPEKPEKPPEDGKSKRHYRRKISNLARENERLQRELEESRKRDTPPEDPQEPKREDFEDLEQYLEARTDYLTDIKLREKEARQQEESEKTKQEEERTQLFESWEDKKENARDRYDDFDDIIDTEDVKVPAHAAQAMLESDIGGDIMYYLAKHPEKADNLEKLSPTRQVIEIGRLETVVQGEIDKLDKPQASKAPPPVDPNKGGKIKDDEPNAKDSTENWAEKRRAQRAQG